MHGTKRFSLSCSPWLWPPEWGPPWWRRPPRARSVLPSSCPNVGTGIGCAYVVTVNPNGTVSISPGANTTATDASGHGEGDDVMVGVLNNSNAVVTSITLSGSGRDNMFGFDGDGICTWNFVS